MKVKNINGTANRKTYSHFRCCWISSQN